MKDRNNLNQQNIISNIGYYFEEVRIMIKMNMSSHILSLVSTGLIFFILAMVASGWWVSNQVIEVIQGEAEINVYFDESIEGNNTLQLIERIESIEGVGEARLVEEDESYSRMAEILGREARVLEFFDENPFSSFIEVKINLEEIDPILEKTNLIEGIEAIRDNREVLDRLREIGGILNILSYLIVAAVGISTLVITSHIIRLGIYNNREQIKTLRLLGAPESFIAFPYLIEGLILTLGGGVLSIGLTAFTLNYVFAQMASPLPFIPLPPIGNLILGVSILVMSLSIFLGITGGLLGLSTAKNKG